VAIVEHEGCVPLGRQYDARLWIAPLLNKIRASELAIDTILFASDALEVTNLHVVLVP
jgi:hypothetical protein